jgi:hypothetical protein
MDSFRCFDKQRPYTARKLNPEKDNACIEKLEEYFNDPNKYLEVDNKLIIGKPIKGTTLDENNKPKPFTYIGTIDQFHKPNDIISNPPSKLKSQRSINSPKLPPMNYEIIDDKKLNKIFEEAKARVKNNEVKINNCIENNKNIQRLTKEKFYQQERILKETDNERCRSANLNKKLADKTKKNNEELLIFESDGLHTKKQIKQKIDNKRPLVETYGDYAWMMDLKRPKLISQIRTAYVNLAPKINNLLFDEVKEYPKKPVEFTHRPFTPGIKQLDRFKEFDGVLKKNRIDTARIKEMPGLCIQGQNLLDDEFKRARKQSGKKYLYKESYAHKQKEEVYKENYDDRIYLNNRLFGLN